ncbi:MAG: hypothetical protein HQL73_13210 [Magnetococcales bacterium]|nr:hypothetical protein [Magnetococcales bacterium]
MSENGSIASIVPNSLKSLFRSSPVGQPSVQEATETENFDQTLAEATASTQKQEASEVGHADKDRPRQPGDATTGLDTPSRAANDQGAPATAFPTSDGLLAGHSSATWQLISSTTDVDQNEDILPTATLPLKGFRIYSVAAGKGHSDHL